MTHSRFFVVASTLVVASPTLLGLPDEEHHPRISKLSPTPHLFFECFLNSESWLVPGVQMNHKFMSGLEFCTKIQTYKYQCVSCVFI